MAIGGFYAVYRFFDGTLRPPAIVAHLLVVLTWLAWTAGVVMLDFTIYHGLVWSLGIIGATAAIDCLLALASEPPGDSAMGQASGRRALIITTLRRIVLAVAGTLVAGLVARLWLVDILGVVDKEYWKLVREAVITALGVLVAGYAVYELLRAWTKAKFGDYGAATPLADDEHAAPATRLSSIMPVLQGALGALIIATALLLALSHLGVNVAPLIAGAGIFGLAIGFGSQALVRDIVAGIFYLFDDAFRLGEYIEAGKHKGTVERIALRSVRLRHQNGQIHTLPYGQLGAVTNYSRDYATIKFNLRLARDTDVEKVRKLVKKIGQQMLDDLEHGKEFILPLKMQGVADILENALLCRFKFTVRPGKPTVIQRDALKRLYRVFTEQGIAFASNAVVVQSASGSAPIEMSAAARVAMAAAVDRSAVAPADGNLVPSAQRTPRPV
jgi:small-conductance mechanosensitive channel